MNSINKEIHSTVYIDFNSDISFDFDSGISFSRKNLLQ